MSTSHHEVLRRLEDAMSDLEGRHVGRDQSFEKPISRPAGDKLDGSIRKKKIGSFNLRRSLATHRKVLGDQAVEEICAIS